MCSKFLLFIAPGYAHMQVNLNRLDHLSTLDATDVSKYTRQPSQFQCLCSRAGEHGNETIRIVHSSMYHGLHWLLVSTTSAFSLTNWVKYRLGNLQSDW